MSTIPPMHPAGRGMPAVAYGGATRESVVAHANRMVEETVTKLIRRHYDYYQACQLATDNLVAERPRQLMVSIETAEIRQLRALERWARTHGIVPPDGGDLYGWVTRGRVQFGRLRGDRGIVWAMAANERDLCDDYQEAVSQRGLPPDLRALLNAGLQVERQHQIAIDRC